MYFYEIKCLSRIVFTIHEKHKNACNKLNVSWAGHILTIKMSKGLAKSSKTNIVLSLVHTYTWQCHTVDIYNNCGACSDKKILDLNVVIL